MGNLTNIARLVFALYCAYAARNGPFGTVMKQVLWVVSLMTVTLVMIAEAAALLQLFRTGV